MISKKGRPILAAIGVKTVATDHQTTPKPNTRFPPILSAQMPPTICLPKKRKQNPVSRKGWQELSFDHSREN